MFRRWSSGAWVFCGADTVSDELFVLSFGGNALCTGIHTVIFLTMLLSLDCNSFTLTIFEHITSTISGALMCCGWLLIVLVVLIVGCHRTFALCPESSVAETVVRKRWIYFEFSIHLSVATLDLDNILHSHGSTEQYRDGKSSSDDEDSANSWESTKWTEPVTWVFNTSSGSYYVLFWLKNI